MWCCGYIPSVSQNPICCLVFLLPWPRIAKSQMDDGEGWKKRERDQYEDKACKTLLEMEKTGENDGGDGMDLSFR